jgi:hypothetical protein
MDVKIGIGKGLHAPPLGFASCNPSAIEIRNRRSG